MRAGKIEFKSEHGDNALDGQDIRIKAAQARLESERRAIENLQFVLGYN